MNRQEFIHWQKPDGSKAEATCGISRIFLGNYLVYTCIIKKGVQKHPFLYYTCCPKTVSLARSPSLLPCLQLGSRLSSIWAWVCPSGNGQKTVPF